MFQNMMKIKRAHKNTSSGQLFSSVATFLEKRNFVVSQNHTELLFRRKRHKNEGSATRFILLIQVEGCIYFEEESIICEYSLIRQLKVIVLSLIMPSIALSCLKSHYLFTILLSACITGFIWYLWSLKVSKRILEDALLPTT